MEPTNEIAMEPQDEREWELHDEMLDRHGPARACPTAMLPCCCPGPGCK